MTWVLIIFGIVPGIQCFDLARFDSELACEDRRAEMMVDSHYRPMGLFCVAVKDE